MSLIKLKNVGKTYANGTVALRNVNLTVEQGEFAYVVGPSGAGKSTFIKMLYGAVEPTTGGLRVGQFNVHQLKRKDLPLLRQRVGVVFQDFKLLKQRTVYANVAYALEVIETPEDEIHDKVMDVLALVQLADKADVYPSQLSGGEQQRVAIARAIVNKPVLLIADEPTGNLDPDVAWQIMKLFERISLNGTTIIMATHNNQIVNTLRHRVIAIEDGTIVRDEESGEYGY